MASNREPVSEARRILLIKATRARQQIASLPSDIHKHHEAAISSYIAALREWEKEKGAYPEPPRLDVNLKLSRPPALPSAPPAAPMRNGSVTGEQVRNARILLGWSQRTLAKKAEVSDSFVWRLENVDGAVRRGGGALHRIETVFQAAGITFQTLEASNDFFQIRRADGYERL